MQDLKISLITVTRNAQNTLGRCIESVKAQNYANIEFIVIDGASTDATLRIIEKYRPYIHHFISEPDQGIYDAMNKGIQLAGGDIIGVLNADDYFADNEVLSAVAKGFAHKYSDIVYGDLNYVDLQGRIKRKWQTGQYRHGMFNWGWMPPHPTFYCRRQLFEKYGTYNLQYGTAADYELMLRFIHCNHRLTCYVKKVMVNMTIGGVSNKSYQNRVQAWKNDYKAMRQHGVIFPWICILFKPLRKIFQFI